MGIREMVLDRAKREGNKVGRKEGKEESQINIIKNLFLSKRFTTNEISTFVGVSESFVLKVMKSLNE